MAIIKQLTVRSSDQPDIDLKWVQDRALSITQEDACLFVEVDGARELIEAMQQMLGDLDDDQ